MFALSPPPPSRRRLFQIAACSAENEEVTAIEKAEALMTSAYRDREQAFTVWSAARSWRRLLLRFVRRSATSRARGDAREEHGACATATDQEACKRSIAALRELTETCEDLPEERGLSHELLSVRRAATRCGRRARSRDREARGSDRRPERGLAAARGARATTSSLSAPPESVPAARAVDDGIRSSPKTDAKLTCTCASRTSTSTPTAAWPEPRRRSSLRATEEYTCVMPTRRALLTSC